MKWFIALLALSAAWISAPAETHAQGRSNYLPAQSEQRVPLRDVFRKLERQFGGYQLGMQEVTRGGRTEYHIDWLTRDGRQMRVVVDASSGRIISTRGG